MIPIIVVVSIEGVVFIFIERLRNYKVKVAIPIVVSPRTGIGIVNIIDEAPRTDSLKRKQILFP